MMCTLARFGLAAVLVASLLGCSDSDDNKTIQDGGAADGGVLDRGLVDTVNDRAATDTTTMDTGGTTTFGGVYYVVTKAGKLTAMNLNNCKITELFSFTPSDIPARARVSPNGKWLFVYFKNAMDGYALDIAQKSKVKLLKPGGGMVAWRQDETMVITGYGSYSTGMIYELPGGNEYLSNNIKLNFPNFIDSGKKAYYIDYDSKEARVMDLSTKQYKKVYSRCWSVSADLTGQMTCYVKTTSANSVKFIDQSGAVSKTVELGQFKQYTNQSPRLTPDGRLLVWGEADSKNNITLYAMDLASQKKVKLTEELGATGTHMALSWDSKSVAFADEIVSLQTGKQVCPLDLKDIRNYAGFAKK